jgi:hypothetical protein
MVESLEVGGHCHPRVTGPPRALARKFSDAELNEDVDQIVDVEELPDFPFHVFSDAEAIRDFIGAGQMPPARAASKHTLSH